VLTHKKKVIQLFTGWKFWDYVSPAGNNKIQEWIENDLLDDGRLMFDKLVKNIRNTENHLNWVGWRRFIKRGKEKVWELGFFADGRQYRILGDFVGGKEAVFIIGYYHKQRVSTPTDAIDEAFKRKGLLKNGTATHDARAVSVY
jgi:hypothetical protein